MKHTLLQLFQEQVDECDNWQHVEMLLSAYQSLDKKGLTDEPLVILKPLVYLSSNEYETEFFNFVSEMIDKVIPSARTQNIKQRKDLVRQWWLHHEWEWCEGLEEIFQQKTVTVVTKKNYHTLYRADFLDNGIFWTSLFDKDES